MQEELLSTAEVAERLSVSVRRVKQLLQQGRLNPERVGRTLVFRAADVAAITRRPAGRPRKSEERG